ncbi:DUF2924 domain-containing protein [Myxococcus xanthus]|uniref:DUF2924 domain-containing protein n=1 Tax=Myxococcus xanthus TaxID=34 RepID=UPI00034DCF10|nr:DUF2924 domain-containing protein [Myxococcus xanthus]QVW70573.1 DUF2924 domain-containing protein [Myxococcus xanthus DZ2]QZZ49465.1 hypothetical protein MyxoNM_09650 [Myxococcus xanthus]UEO03300.1 DUF2924 domain-containing protein [Myxococcus xanthus DZ2]UYI16539.1 DUF2924 domain-containing protein [Myxococcus xanthus]UYI23902.1 DUF2924 domain-containing protein [Myxococcus xanthus]
MPRTTASKTKKLESMNLTELRARYREVVGEETRSPNKKYLIRRIEESLAAKKRRSPSRRATAAAPSAPPAPAAPAATPAAGTQPAPKRGRFAGMSLEELQAKYREVVGRPTGSSDISYLKWKIREAEAGRVPVGPRPERELKVREDGKRVIPLSFEAEALEGLDKTWRDAGIPSRTEFFRRAVHRELTAMGATEAAAHFATKAEG